MLPHPPTAAGSLLAPTRMPASADEPTAAVPRTACACRPAQTTAGPGRSAVRAHAGHPPLPFRDNKSEQQARDRTLAIPQVLESRRASLSQGASHLRAQTGLTRVRLSSEVGGARSQRALSWGSLKRSRSFDHRSLPKGMVKPGPRRRTTSQRRLARHTSRRSNTPRGPGHAVTTHRGGDTRYSAEVVRFGPQAHRNGYYIHTTCRALTVFQSGRAGGQQERATSEEPNACDSQVLGSRRASFAVTLHTFGLRPGSHTVRLSSELGGARSQRAPS